MSSVRSWPSLGGDKEPVRAVSSAGDIVKMGYLKKLKTMKKKYFVLRGDSAEASACLEYYDSEKKFKSNHAPKRSITLKTCFNINKRSDTRQKWVIALYTKNDCFCLVMETEEELEDWLKMLLTLQHGEDVPDGEQPRPTFEHVWHVDVQKKELGHSRNILGPYRLCLTDRTLSLVKMDPDSDKQDTIEFSLQSIRRCGDLESFFYMEVGQMSVTGAGNLWMRTEDNIIAQNMHAAILSACRNCKDMVPVSRNRSHSTNESSRPTIQRSTHDGHSRWAGHSGLSGVRERCDSLPSRPRTTSEGASHIPHHHRHIYLQPSLTGPHPMYNKSISYSPPVVDSSPVSPESRGFSTDSAGSSLSMEGDGMEMGSVSWDGGVDKYGHSLTPDEPVILEENVDDENVHWSHDDYVAPDKHMCLTINSHLLHKNSPNPSSCGFKSSSPSQGSLADMCSPCGSSPLESSAYMAMSTGDKPIVTGNNLSGFRTGLAGGSSSVNHSRGSSLAEDGYVHMAPMLHDDGYIDMEPGGHNRRNTDHYRSGELSPASSCSITSGTPSTDIRFSEYTLDKVSTYITPSEDEITPSERPTRAYSVGSRPTFTKRNDVINQLDCQQRVRAFSVGSRFPRVHSAHLTPPPRHPLSSSHSSVEPSEDLMEIDFTKKSRNRNHSKKPSSSERLSVPPSSVASSAASSYSTAEGSYMEMSSPRGSPKPSDNEMDNSQFCPSPPKNSRILNCIGRSPPKSYLDMKPNFSSSSPPVSGLSSVPLYKVPEGDSSYMEMTSGSKGELLPGSSSPVLLNSVREDRPHSPADSYVEMQPAKSVMAKTCTPRIDSFPVTEQLKPQNFPKVTSSPPIKPALMSTPNITKSKTTQEDYMDMNMKRKLSLVEDNNNKVMVGRTNPIDTPKKVPSGYVEMTVGNPKPSRKPSLDNFKSADFDYMNMSGNGKKERKGSRKGNRYSSQPIAIQSTVSKEQSSSTSPVFTIVGRKHSTGTPPKVPSYLPLGNFSTSPSSSPYSSLGRRSRKTPSRRESRELSSSGSSTPIFPLSLNSPSSPMKPLGHTCNKDKDCYESAAKCPVDARSGTVRICYSPAENATPSQSGQQQSSSCNIPEKNDYINFNPLMNEVKENNDYALMKPINNPFEPSRKISAPPILNNVKSRSIDRIVLGVSNLAVSAPEINSVPINSNNDNVNNNNNSDFIDSVNRTPNTVQSASSDNNLEAAPSALVSSIYDSSNNNRENSLSISEVLSCAVKNEKCSGSSSATADTPKVANNSSVPISSSSSSANTSLDCAYSVNSAAVSSNLAVTGKDPICRISHTSVPVAATTNTVFSSSNTGTSTALVNTCCTSFVGDKELHYASLDLARSDSVEESSGNSNNTINSLPLRNQSSTSSASTPSPNIGQNVAPTLTYAEIDFSKSNCSNANSPVH